MRNVSTPNGSMSSRILMDCASADAQGKLHIYETERVSLLNLFENRITFKVLMELSESAIDEQRKLCVISLL